MDWLLTIPGFFILPFFNLFVMHIHCKMKLCPFFFLEIPDANLVGDRVG
jgi:hypothetical protein